MNEWSFREGGDEFADGREIAANSMRDWIGDPEV